MGGLQRTEEHHHAGHHGKAEDELHRGDELIHHALHLGQHGGHVDDREVGEPGDQARHEVGLRRRQVEAGDVARRKIRQQAGAGDDEEVHPHGVPVQLAQAGDGGFDDLAGHVEAQDVAHPEAQGLGQALLHREAWRGVVAVPGAGDDPVARRQRGVVGEVEVPVHQAAGAVVGVVVRAHRAAIHGDQAAADHGQQHGCGPAGGAEGVAQGVELVRLDTDDEAVGGVRRGGLLPAGEQVAAHQGEEQQRGEAHAQGQHLHQAGAGSPAQGGEAVAPAAARTGADASDAAQHDPADAGEDTEGGDEAAGDPGAEGDVPRHEHQQPGEHGGAEAPGEAVAHRHAAQLAAQHAQGGHAAEADQGRQGEAQQQHEGHGEPVGQGPDARRRQLEAHQAAEEAFQGVLHAKAEGAAGEAASQAQQGEFADEEAQQGCLAGAQAAHHGAAVQVAFDEAAGGEAYRHRGEDHREHGGEAQEAFGAVEGGADLGAGVVHAFEGFAAPQAGLGPGFVARHGGDAAGQMEAVGDAAAGHDEAGGGQVGGVHDDARQQGKEVGAPVGLEAEHGGHAQARAAEADEIARVGAEGRRAAFVEPHLAGRGDAAGGGVRLVEAGGDADLAAQGVARLHRLDADELGRVAEAGHAGEGGGFDAGEAAAGGFGAEVRRQRVVGGDEQVAAQELAGLAVEAAADPVGEEADAGEAGDGDDEGDEEQTQFAGTQVAAEHAEGQGEALADGHGA